MGRQKNAAIFRILAFYGLLSTVMSQAEPSDEFAYDIITGSTVTYRCIGASNSFIPSTTFSDNSRTFAFCDLDGDGRQLIETSCDGPTVLYTELRETGADRSGYYVCTGTHVCFTATVFRFYNGGRGSSPRDLIGCDNSTAWPTYFMENPDDWTTSIPDGTITVTVPGEATTVTRDATERKAASTEIPHTTSSNLVDLATQLSTTESSTSQSSTTQPSSAGGGSHGPSTGTIVGAVVGAVSGLAAIVGALIISFRMGRRHQSLDNQEAGTRKSFRDTISSLPRPAITWVHPGTKKSPTSDEQKPSVLQASFPDDAAGISTKGPAELPSPISQTPGNQAQNMLQPISTQTHAAAGVESPSTELPAGPEAQGWARSESHPSPYEADSTQR
ncbi:hypothetical protein BHE90_000111 [Fusarium euwallaceae]|uniref:Ig-like domain-containing protein n=1 Tax=Fusarium euwallaceae TaxID=1147111 RepID=A0A430MBK0_9HYPO|nr:hypothetical protein BHE90_000111 [Fusarium euwallaceae]